eukprot:CAMPEP_0179914812 /NCGR_PEP_ID=MMETSP0983-20121128/1308_1 /TAXON_ID=483367 /ORGANISM="non described non described, Strain CCMP 2436" /LENGTH=126 /DNA_ID=CAMNT_0021817123 /DNA_START=404 /DNA_END=781 /DNA_ORIENTATION=-
MTFSYPSIVLRRPLLLDAAKALHPRATCPVRTAAAQACTVHALHLPMPSNHDAHRPFSTAPAGSYGELDRLPDNATLNSLLQTLSSTTMIEHDVMHEFIAGLATFGLDGGGVAADPKSAARFQREL